MACTYTEYPSADPTATTAAPVPTLSGAPSGPYLVVSNHPETLSDDGKNLHKCQIPLSAGVKQRTRVFVWHLAPSSTCYTFKIGAYVGAGTATLDNFAGHVEVDGASVVGNLPLAGLGCAKATLYGYDSTFPGASLSTTESTIFTQASAAKYILGAVLEFDVTTSDKTTLCLRTYVGTAAESEDPVDTSHRHIRGWWPYSEATFDVSGSLDVNPAASSPSSP